MGRRNEMGLLSRLMSRRKIAPPTPEEPVHVTPAALQRALRATSTASGSFSAAELGQRIATALSTIETSVLAIDAVMERLREAAELAADAGRNEDVGRRALMAGRYDDVRAEIDAIVGSASHNRINLISGRRIAGQYMSFEIALDGEERAGIAIPVIDLTTGEKGLSLSPPRNAFADDAEIEAISKEIEAARALALQASDRFADHAALISDRLARLKSIAGPRSIETQLPTGADTAVEPNANTEEYDLGMASVEDKLKALAERRNARHNPDAGDTGA